MVFNANGARTITAFYSGDGNYGSSSRIENHTVATPKIPTSITFGADNPPVSMPGGPVVLSVIVSGASIPKPSGHVIITGADSACDILLAADGTGSCTVVFNTTGHKPLVATYSGDLDYAASSANSSHTVTIGPSTTEILTDDPDPSIPGQQVAVTVRVNGGGVKPTGTVDITGADVNCRITLLANGTGTCNVVFNTFGLGKSIFATYNGDSNYSSSSTLATLHDVKNPTTTVITSHLPNPSYPSSVAGEEVTVNVTVTGDGVVVPTGTVTITGSDTAGTVSCALDGTGKTVGCLVMFTSAGARTITATYVPGADPRYVASSGTAIHTVNKGTSLQTFQITTPANGATTLVNTVVPVTVVVLGKGVMPTGTVSISVIGLPSASCTIYLSGGTGTCNDLVFNTVGTYTMTATYSGDNNYEVQVIHISHIVN